jgi:branched-chain amino acid transport system permease protein
VAVNSFFEIPALTGGGQGLAAARPALFSGDAAYAYFCLAILGLVIFVDWRLLASKLGRGILAIKESEAVAASYGVNVTTYKVAAFVLSGVFAGLAGALLGPIDDQVVAANFQFSIALLWVLMVVVGGLGNRVGVVIGSAFFALFTHIVGLIDRSRSSWRTRSTGRRMSSRD